MKIKKAIVAVAGSGARFLPATKSQPKEMLPIIDKPIIQYLVEELVAAGIEDIIFVTSLGKKTLEDHFDRSFEVEHRLEQEGKTYALEQVRKISSLANFVYVRQIQQYGNGAPILSARRLVKDEPFVFAFGDDLVKSQVPFTKQLIKSYEKHQCPMIGVQKVPEDQVDQYGIVKLKPGTKEIADLVEKPNIKRAPSQLAQFGRMILTQEIIDELLETPVGKGKELWIADAVKKYVKKGGKVMVREVQGGEWMTTGDPLNYLDRKSTRLNSSHIPLSRMPSSA